MKHEATEQRNGSRNTVWETAARKLKQLPLLDEEGVKATVADVDKRFDEGYAAGLFSFEEVKQGKDSFRYGVFLTDFNIATPEITKKKLDAKEYGMSAESHKKATTLYNTEITRIQNESEEELDTMDYNNTLTDKTIERYVAEGRIDSKSGKARKEALISEEAENPDPFAYNSMLERASDVSHMNKKWWNQKYAFK